MTEKPDTLGSFTEQQRENSARPSGLALTVTLSFGAAASYFGLARLFRYLVRCDGWYDTLGTCLGVFLLAACVIPGALVMTGLMVEDNSDHVFHLMAIEAACVIAFIELLTINTPLFIVTTIIASVSGLAWAIQTLRRS